MDRPRKNIARRRRIVRGAWMVVGLAAIAAITLGLSRLKPAAPSVDRATLFTGDVERGEMLREVRGTGRLVPEVVWFIPATTAGRIEEIVVLPGTVVQADTVLIELSNPQLQLEAVDAEWKLKSAEASFKSLEVRLQDEELALQASAARVEADLAEASLQLEVNQELFDDGLISERNLMLAKGRVAELKKLNAIERKRLALSDSSQEARLADQRARVEQARALSGLRTEQLDLLHVRAGTPGVLEQLQVQVGEQVAGDAGCTPRGEPPRATLFLPHQQAPLRRMTLVARTVSDPMGVAAGLRDAIQAKDPGVPLGGVRTVDDIIRRWLRKDRLFVGFLLGVAGLALSLAAIGLYGVMSYAVAQRTHEIGVRVALGAERHDVIRLVLRRCLTLTAVGIGVGILLSIPVSVLLARQLYGVGAVDPATFIGVPVVLLFVSMLAGYLPARRATKVDPMVALRCE